MINDNNNLYGNSRTEEELEKAKKYQDLAREILRLWKTSANVIVVGAVGPVASLDEYMSMWDIVKREVDGV